MYESDDIVRYLYRRYGAGRAPLAITLPIVTETPPFPSPIS